MPAISEHLESRLSPRSSARGHALVQAGATRIGAEIVNVSLGGALLLVHNAPTLPRIGAQVWGEVRLADGARWYEISARVQRSDPARSILALEFVVLDAELEDAICEVVLDGLAAEDRPPVLLVDLDPARRQRLSRVLRMSGCATIEAATPLDAIRLCEASSVPVAGAAVLDDGSQDYAELAAFLARSSEVEVTWIVPWRGRILDELRLLARTVRTMSHH